MSDRQEPKLLDPDSGAASVNLGSSATSTVNASASAGTNSFSNAMNLIKARFDNLNMRQKMGLAGAALFLVVAVAGVSMSGNKSGQYKVLFSNLTDTDGAAIVASLQQMDVPYKFTEGGGALMVPESSVYDARLKLAGQGLPKSGTVGFEVLENQKLGTSQFVEQVNYQRALEGELSKSITSIGSIKIARVHLAVPKQTAFVRDQEKPTASVVLKMYPGRFLDPQQVVAITYLVSSSVPKLSPAQVSIVDQDGNLLSHQPQRADSLDSSQIKYVAELEHALSKRIAILLEPVIGKDNVRAQVTLDLNFDERTLTQETYGKNSAPNQASVRSQQNSESTGQQSTTGAVPGALTNQAPPQPVAPLSGPLAADNEAQQLISPSSTMGANSSGKRDSTINYEVDRAIEVLKANKGQLKRVAAAVVVNFKPAIMDRDGAVVESAAPYSPEEMQQINNIVRDAVGFVEKRGDTVSVANIAFAPEVTEKIPFYKDASLTDLIKEFLKFGILLLALILAYLTVMRTLIAPKKAKELEQEAQATEDVMEQMQQARIRERNFREQAEVRQKAEEARENARAAEEALRAEYDNLVSYTEDFVKANPQVLASLLKNWQETKAKIDAARNNLSGDSKAAGGNI
ncbi:flagellar basal-body MS-ring/collar protein FliF [Polynucleobacter corsicus]|uniref:flagellar basal-body MS-ring/collar protein FliF n=1 Tax=Polynucleobacter corsicus TaxID=2081042 RepID=UPI001BFD0CAE|nr:flagellar basal-body MS-ring/collar protein FliF [Polynucleobacter corsicus]QWE19314.1 flagellar M-ring protein FliF [Polynucleobacter corsicus]